MKRRLLLAVMASLCSAASVPSGGELRFCLHSEPKTFNPLLVDDDASETIRYLTGGVLIRINRQTQELQPELAESWKILDGGRTIAFRCAAAWLSPTGLHFRRRTWPTLSGRSWIRNCIRRQPILSAQTTGRRMFVSRRPTRSPSRSRRRFPDWNGFSTRSRFSLRTRRPRSGQCWDPSLWPATSLALKYC